MPVNAMIARGFEPVGRDLPEIGNMLYQRRMSEEQNARRNELLQMEREQNAARNAMLDEKMGWAREDRALASDERAKAAEEAEIRDLYRMGDIDAIIRKVEPRNPQLAEAMRRDPARTAEMLRKRFGDPGPIESQNLDGARFYTQDGRVVASRMPPQPQQYGPESFSTELDDQGNILLVGNRGTIRETGRKGPVKGGEADAKTETNPLGLNDRQQAGINMQRENAISYAASLAGMSRDDVVKIYREQGPDGVARLVRERGGRLLQGARARMVQGIPFVGKGIVEATNADLIAPAKGGGAGIALFQNPTGPVTTPDFQAGEAQFPNATYPLETQAEMLRQMLSDPAGTKSAEQGGDPLAQYAGQVIRQGGKRYQVMQGRDGKFMAVEVK